MCELTTLDESDTDASEEDIIVADMVEEVRPEAISCLKQVNSTGREVIPKGKTYPQTTGRVKINNGYVVMQVDSGAEANIINEVAYTSMDPRPKLRKTSTKLKPYNSHPLPVLGFFTATMKAHGQTSKETTIYVTEGAKCKNLLGRYTAFDLGILQINLDTLAVSDGERCGMMEMVKRKKTDGGKEVRKQTPVKHMSYA